MGRRRPNREGSASWWSRRSRWRSACSSPERSSSRSSKARADRQGLRPIAFSWRRSTSTQLEFSPDAADAFYQRLLDGASRLPDADAVGLARRTAVWTFGRGKGPGSVVVWAPGREPEVVIGGYAGGDLFGALGLRLVAGRTFTAADATGAPHVAIVNRAYAEQLPERQALGRTIRVRQYVQSRRLSDEEALAASREVTIVGVIESAGERRYTQDGKPVGKVYLPSPLGPEPALTLYARSRGTAEAVAPSVRDLVSRIDPRVPIVEMGSLAVIQRAVDGARTLAGPDLGAAGCGRAACWPRPAFSPWFPIP